MHPASGVLLVAALALLHRAGVARHLPGTASEPGPRPCLRRSQGLLQAVDLTLRTARQILELYPCTAEEIDHVDITRDRTSTVTACLPPELIKNGSCLVSGETTVLIKGSCLAAAEPSENMTLCLSSIYEDLKTYRVEFRALKEQLWMDPERQIFLATDMLEPMDALMRALNSGSEVAPQQPSLEEPNSYKMKKKLCILLHAFRIRAVTIDRVMSYLSASQ
ncbi:interleukin-12 subunit alpha [Perognathus longimembris pacificus]|uniref:interleukin-12 subunit alpha n=1 Tax=Perognathus longimembris pacificus TaxID=214514 RepID=UPI002019578F|nr:interleukin-12 subunit alpha [Perognathus longimembris pacificus]